MLTWSFPNRRAWRSEEYGGINVGQYSDDVVGNAYAVAYPDSWQTAIDVAARLDELEHATVQSLRAVVETDAPVELVEAALFNLSTLRSPTVFQTADGEYYGWEGSATAPAAATAPAPTSGATSSPPRCCSRPSPARSATPSSPAAPTRPG